MEEQRQADVYLREYFTLEAITAVVSRNQNWSVPYSDHKKTSVISQGWESCCVTGLMNQYISRMRISKNTFCTTIAKVFLAGQRTPKDE